MKKIIVGVALMFLVVLSGCTDSNSAITIKNEFDEAHKYMRAQPKKYLDIFRQVVVGMGDDIAVMVISNQYSDKEMFDIIWKQDADSAVKAHYLWTAADYGYNTCLTDKDIFLTIVNAKFMNTSCRYDFVSSEPSDDISIRGEGDIHTDMSGSKIFNLQDRRTEFYAQAIERTITRLHKVGRSNIILSGYKTDRLGNKVYWWQTGRQLLFIELVNGYKGKLQQ